MAIKFDDAIDLTKHELQNGVFQNLSAPPSSPVIGQFYFDSALGMQGTWSGTAWIYSGLVGVTASSTTTFTNKTIDANAPGNAITNLEVADFAPGVVNTAAGLAAATAVQLAGALAVKNAVDALNLSLSNVIANADALVLKGAIDASTNPNFPAADAGHLYKISVAGKIGGAAGVDVQQGDTVTCFVDGTLAGTQAVVGANWIVSQANVDAATQTVQGLTQYATAAETKAKSITTKSVTPGSLADFPISQEILFGNAVLTTFTIPHGRGSTKVDASVYDAATGEKRYPKIVIDATNVTISGYIVAPTLNAMRVCIIG